jgi:hypothetical protein
MQVICSINIRNWQHSYELFDKRILSKTIKLFMTCFVSKIPV